MFEAIKRPITIDKEICFMYDGASNNEFLSTRQNK